MKKNIIVFVLLSIISIIGSTLLIIFSVPQIVPYIVDINEKIVVLGSKWFLLLGLIAPTIIFVLYWTLKNAQTKQFLLILMTLCVYINVLTFSYFCVETSFNIGAFSAIPLSAVIFLPLSLLTFIYGTKIKHLPYKHKLGVRLKNTMITEFIWKQSHIFASYGFMFCGFLELVTSLIFCFARKPLIELVIFLLLTLIAYLFVNKQSSDMVKKYKQLKANQERNEQNKK